MRRIAIIIASIGALTVVGTFMLAFDAFMTDDRRAQVHATINGELDASAEAYEERREAGCRRRCGGGGIASMIVALRDGMFQSLPFDPAAVMPPPPPGYVTEPFTLAAAETLFGREVRRTRTPAETNNRLLLGLEETATRGASAAVQFYRSDESLMAVAIEIDRQALRDAKANALRPVDWPTEPYAFLRGLPVTVHKQTSRDWRDRSEVPVAYRQFSMNLDRQVKIHIFTLAEEGDILALLDGIDLAGIVASLPRTPRGYDMGETLTLQTNAISNNG